MVESIEDGKVVLKNNFGDVKTSVIIVRGVSLVMMTVKVTADKGDGGGMGEYLQCWSFTGDVDRYRSTYGIAEYAANDSGVNWHWW